MDGADKNLVSRDFPFVRESIDHRRAEGFIPPDKFDLQMRIKTCGLQVRNSVANRNETFFIRISILVTAVD